MVERESQPFSEQERAAIAERFKRIKNRHDLLEIRQVLLGIAKQFGRINLGELHVLLREQVSGIYFIARPAEETSLYVARWPHTGEKKYQYQLYICTGGERQYTHWLKTMEVSHEQNLERLKETGLLMPNVVNERRIAKASLN